MTEQDIEQIKKAGELAGQFYGPHLFSDILKKELSSQEPTDESKTALFMIFSFLEDSANYATPEPGARKNYEVRPDIVALFNKGARGVGYSKFAAVKMSQVSWDTHKYSDGPKPTAGWLKRFGPSLAKFCALQGIELPPLFGIYVQINNKAAINIKPSQYRGTKPFSIAKPV